MQKLLVTILVLTAVALSSSNVVPVMTMNQLNAMPIGYNYQENDNTFSNKHHTRNKQNAILFNVDVEPEIDKISANYVDNSDDFSMNNGDSYNVKGFRKEQWHNYPRQLDRLNRYLYQHQSADKRNLDPDEPESNSVASDYRHQEVFDDTLLNDYDPENEPDTRTSNHEAEMAAAVINPLLIFRIHLACYNNNKAAKPTRLETVDLDNERLQNFNKNENSFSNEVNTGPNQIKVKRGDKINSGDIDTEHASENPTVNKRLFALFSRLQSLNPKGHQLHHRRHMYAIYGPQDGGGGSGGGGGVLTAETRATFMRPPGSPLRWG